MLINICFITGLKIKSWNLSQQKYLLPNLTFAPANELTVAGNVLKFMHIEYCRLPHALSDTKTQKLEEMCSMARRQKVWHEI